MSNMDEMRKLNQEGSMATENAKEGSQMKKVQTNSDMSKVWKQIVEGDNQINSEREKLETLYNIRIAMQSKKSLLELIQKRKHFFAKYHWMLEDFVLLGKYLLAQDGTVKRIEVKEKLPEGLPDLIPMKDFERSVTSFTTTEIEDLSAEFSNWQDKNE